MVLIMSGWLSVVLNMVCIIMSVDGYQWSLTYVLSCMWVVIRVVLNMVCIIMSGWLSVVLNMVCIIMYVSGYPSGP